MFHVSEILTFPAQGDLKEYQFQRKIPVLHNLIEQYKAMVMLGGETVREL